MKKEPLLYGNFETPIGKMAFAVNSKGIHRLSWAKHPQEKTPPAHLSSNEIEQSMHILEQTKRAIHNYFKHRTPLIDIPLAWKSRTDFQQRVYQALQKIPMGQIITYGDLALLVRSPGAARAVGRAMSQNPWPLIVPCHRVVGAKGHLGGFSAGLWRKSFLLDLEGTLPPWGTNTHPDLLDTARLMNE